MDLEELTKNREKHKVTAQEAEEIFYNEPKIILYDNKHSATEKRYTLYGITSAGRKLTTVFTVRRNKFRVISARDMHIKERRFYNERT